MQSTNAKSPSSEEELKRKCILLLCSLDKDDLCAPEWAPAKADNISLPVTAKAGGIWLGTQPFIVLGFRVNYWLTPG